MRKQTQKQATENKEELHSTCRYTCWIEVEWWYDVAVCGIYSTRRSVYSLLKAKFFLCAHFSFSPDCFFASYVDGKKEEAEEYTSTVQEWNCSATFASFILLNHKKSFSFWTFLNKKKNSGRFCSALYCQCACASMERARKKVCFSKNYNAHKKFSMFVCLVGKQEFGILGRILGRFWCVFQIL